MPPKRRRRNCLKSIAPGSWDIPVLCQLILRLSQQQVAKEMLLHARVLIRRLDEGILSSTGALSSKPLLMLLERTWHTYGTVKIFINKVVVVDEQNEYYSFRFYYFSQFVIFPQRVIFVLFFC